MMRNAAAFLLALLLPLTFTACGRRADGGASGTISSGASSDRADASRAPGKDSTTSGEGTVNTYENAGEGDLVTGLLSFRDTLSDLYGDMYYPDTQMTEAQIENEIGLDRSLYEEIYAENTAQKAHPDTFIAVKAKDGREDDVRRKLEDYKQKLLRDNDFAANTDKVNAAQIFRAGDYVFFVLAGDVEDAGEETDLAKAFGDVVRRGADAIRNAVSKT